MDGKVLAIEAVQVLQNANNKIDLVAGRRTHVRAYLKLGTPIPAGASIEAKLRVTVFSDTSPPKNRTIPCLAPLRFQGNVGLLAQRRLWARSLNFELPDSLLDGVYFAARTRGRGRVAQVKLEVFDFSATRHDGKPVKLQGLWGADEDREVEIRFVASEESFAQNRNPGIKLRCRAVVMRYTDLNTLAIHRPGASEVEFIRRYLENIMPISELEWSTVTVDVSRSFRGLRRTLGDTSSAVEETDNVYISIFRQLVTIRQQDVYFGRDPRTLYLGLLDDPSGRIGGASMDSPEFAASHVVALSPPDGAIAAHELGHVLGLVHPGIPRRSVHGPIIGQRNQLRPKETSLNDLGHLSTKTTEREIYLGFMQSIGPYGGRTAIPTVLGNDEWFDLMTYREPKWVSDSSYDLLLERIIEIDDLYKTSEINAASPGAKKPKFWAIIGEFNTRRPTGDIHYIVPAPFPSRIDTSKVESDPRVKTELKTDNFKCDLYTKRNPPLAANPNAGVVYHVLDKSKVEKSKAVEVLIDNAVVAELRLVSTGSVTQALKQIRKILRSPSPSRPPRDPVIKGIGSKNLMPGCVLEYSNDEGEYYLRYDWRPLGLRIMTTILGQRSEGAVYETLYVSRRPIGRVWLSQRFVGGLRKYRDTCLGDELAQEVGGINELKRSLGPKLKIVVACGLKRRIADFAQSGVQIESFGTKLFGSSYAPDEQTARADREPTWYPSNT